MLQANGAFFINFIYQHTRFRAPLSPADARAEICCCSRIKRFQRSFFHLFRHLVRQLVGGSAFNRAVLSAADAVRRASFRKSSSIWKSSSVPPEAHNKSGAQGQIRSEFAPLLNARQR